MGTELGWDSGCDDWRVRHCGGAGHYTVDICVYIQIQSHKFRKTLWYKTNCTSIVKTVLHHLMQLNRSFCICGGASVESLVKDPVPYQLGMCNTLTLLLWALTFCSHKWCLLPGVTQVLRTSLAAPTWLECDHKESSSVSCHQAGPPAVLEQQANLHDLEDIPGCPPGQTWKQHCQGYFHSEALQACLWWHPDVLGIRPYLLWGG